MDKQSKQIIIEASRVSIIDTGSPSVQLALLQTRIEHVVEHLKRHDKDNSARRGLIQMVGRRRRLIEYVKRQNQKELESITESVGM